MENENADDVLNGCRDVGFNPCCKMRRQNLILMSCLDSHRTNREGEGRVIEVPKVSIKLYEIISIFTESSMVSALRGNIFIYCLIDSPIIM